MYLDFFWIFVGFINWFSSANAVYRSQHFEQLTQYKDKFVNKDTVWNQTVQTIHVCALRCLDDNQCSGFFYSSDLCSAYNQKVPNPNDLVTLNGVEFYRKQDQCDGDYTEDVSTSLCYKVHRTYQTWADANQTCIDEGAHLVTADSMEKINVLKSLPANLCNGTFVPLLNRCYWFTSVADEWRNSKEKCFNGSGTPASFPDVDTYIYVVNNAGINGSTEVIWIGVNDLLSEGTYVNWDESPLAFEDFMFNYAVEGNNGLDTIGIMPEENLIWRELLEYSSYRMLCESDIGDEYWIGASDLQVLDTWVWEDGQSVNASYFWSGAPSGDTSKRCAALQFGPSSLHLIDDDCNTAKEFICQKL